MEPVTTGTLASALVKLGAGAAAGPIKDLLNKKVLRFRVAWAASAAAKDHGIPITRKAIRRWLARPDVRDQLAVGSATSVDSAVKNLAWLLPKVSLGQRDQHALELLQLILDEYQRAQSPQSATVLGTAYTQNQITASTKQLGEEVREHSANILEAITAQSPEIFAADLRKLHPWRGAVALDLAQSWPPLRELIHTLVRDGARGPILREWAANPPVRLESAPAEVWCWFGRLASDYGEPDAADTFIEKGISIGAVPANYWRAHVSLNLLREESDTEYVIRRIRDDMARANPPHPLLIAYLALIEDRYPESEAALATWNPADPHDKVIKAQLLCACAKGQGDYNKAIAIAVEASDSGATGMMILAARELMNRGFHGFSDNRLEDFSQARSLAIKARDSRRLWQGDSTEAVLVAVIASILSTDWDRAWKLTKLPPEGEATEEEAQDPRMIRETALLAARMGNSHLASNLAEKVGDPYVTATVNAWSALTLDDRQTAEAEWLKAWEVATSDLERVQTATDLAFLGAEIPNLDELAKRQPEAASRIQGILRVMTAPEDRLTILRARAHESAELTSLLDEFLAGEERYEEAAVALEAGANRWHRPLLMHMAAGRYLQAGKYVEAARASEAALTMAGPGWAAELETLIVRFNALSAQGALAESIQVARHMIAIAPENASVRWGLIHSLVRSGDSQGAWAATNYNGEPVAPRDVHDARIWIGLAATHDTSHLFVSRALAVMRRWPDDPDLVGTFLSQIHRGLLLNPVEPHPSDVEALQAATEQFTKEHPNSLTFREIPVGPDENPLEAMAEIMKQRGERQAALAGLTTKIGQGELPLGMAAEIANTSYTEVAIKRASGFVYSHVPEQSTASAESVNRTLEKDVALDTSAAVTLALLDQAIVDQLIGTFSSVTSTDSAFRDALAGQESLRMRSTLSVNWDEAEQKPVPIVISDELADRLANRADRTVQILTATNRRGWPALRHFTDERIAGSWLSTVDFAITTQTSFWSDDHLLRMAAAEQGIPTFGTVDVVRELVGLNRINPDIAQVAESVLIANFHVDLGFKLEIMQLAAELDGWKPYGTAASLTRPHTWKNPEAVMPFLQEALSRNAGTSPTNTQEWITCAATGLVKISGGDPDVASSNLQVLLGQLFSQPWMRPDLLPFALAGIRRALEESPGAVDPLEPILASMHSSLLREHSAQAAAELLLMWVGHLPQGDRRLAARIILTSG